MTDNLPTQQHDSWHAQVRRWAARRSVVAIGFLLALVSAIAHSAETAPVEPSKREDEALANVLEHLGYLHFLALDDYAQLREMVDVNLNNHLTKLRERRGSIGDRELRAAEIRALNAIAVLWDARAPFQSDGWRRTELNASWWPQWRDALDKNLALLKWAQAQCAAIPELKCRTSPPGSTEAPQ